MMKSMHLFGSDRAAQAFGFLTIVMALTVAEILLRYGILNVYVIPLPSETIVSIARIASEESLLPRFALTLLEALAATFLLCLVGISCGALMARWRILREATESWVAALAAAPLILAYPLFMVIFGRSVVTIVMLGFLAGLPPVTLKTLEGLTSVRPTLMNVGRGLNLTGLQLFFKIQLPAALPTIFVGIRLGLLFSLINIVGLEFLINFRGLGQLINELAERYDLPGTYAAIIVVIAVSMLVYFVIERLERWIRPGR